uniref:Uncharacterized protein n=1 Tax=Tanacetum cinerariifolium TaxID=118510 RepID=A0A6L2LVB9_TANCI|nr:hypothetical protein [Tanacetum cinerariifolium]
MMNIDVRLEEPSTQTPHLLTIHVTILPKEVSNCATPVIQSTITESLENDVLAKSSSQPKSSYEATGPLTEFKLKKILLDKMQKSKSYRGAQEHKELYEGQDKSYKLDKDLFESYGKAYSIKRDRKGKEKDEDPPAGSDQGLKRRKTSKDAKPSKGSKSKESKSSSSKGTKSQPKSSESDWFKKPERLPTPNFDWNARKFVDFRPPQTWISRIAQAEKPPLTFEELMSTLSASQHIRVVILKRVEDLQLGVESYQKKLNINKTETFKSNISKRTLYTAYNNPQGIIYVDKFKRNRLIRSDELYKFSDGTLTSVRSVLHDIASNLRMDYLPK